MDPVKVTCPKCGNRFETRNPFPTTRCQNCGAEVQVKRIAKDASAY